MAQRLLTATSLAIAAVFGAAQAWALGFGPVRASATMGQPLDVSVVLRLQPGETVTDACLSASVVSGDVPIPPGLVSTTFVNPGSGEPRVRVRTSARIDEPFVTVTVNITCEGRLTRQFTVFADPPSLAPVLDPGTGVAVAALPATPAVPAAPTAAGSVVAGGAVAPARSTARATSGVVQEPRRERPPRTTVAVNRARAAAVAPLSGAPAAKVEPSEPVRVSGGAVLQMEGGARLRLDAPIVNTANDQAYARALQQREQAFATAKIAVDVAQAANNSAAQKVASVESSLAAARKETAEAKAALERLRAERADADTFASLAPWLAAACLALLGLAGFLFVRLRRVDSERLKGWLNEPGHNTRQSEFDTVAPATEQFHPEPARASVPNKAVNSGFEHKEEAESSTLAPLPPLPRAGSPFPETQPSSTFEVEHGAGAHDISIEELLDVEQQAEFFVVLGQDDAAIDLLTSHVMASGGASPMPYLKLLEIYRRIGDQTSYERTRKRFNARFNGVASDWLADPNSGRTLDEYPEVVKRIQDAWPRPVDAMAELQTLMFRNDSNLLFELPAYRDIMMLFTLSRDMQDELGEDQLPVDVLLPLNTQTGSGQPTDSRMGPLSADSLEADLRFAMDVGDRNAATGRR